MNNSNTLIATDLDGTLLDHHSYSWQAALPSLKQAKQLGIDVVINTSKTFSEVIELQQSLQLNAPFIVENGSAVFIPQTEQNNKFDSLLLGAERKHIVEKLQQLKKQHAWKFEGYSDWSIEDIQQHTGLDLSSAERSAKRDYSEPLLWLDSDKNLAEFKLAVEDAGFRLLKGGRFYHVLGQSDKGKALVELNKHYYNSQISQLICLGDSFNDLDMLRVADIAVLVRSPAHKFPDFKTEKQLIHTEAEGPQGWREAINKILN
ncbi:HAD-IIB family hydrolase [Agaribacterium haliotis]|uniref:HAD-IIB family hydrolase n=1 Tax=Agaribacterium haliotis TaxID=2013869 RepID=UPI000BB54205|nr:HAD-IIB family hydrolase [Agaribacterium haliotis]